MEQVVLEKAGFATPVTPISSQGVRRFGVSVENMFNAMFNGNRAFSRMAFTAPSEVTISGGVLSAPTLAIHSVKAETGTADDLNTIGASNNRYVVLIAKSGHSIALVHGAGNVTIPGGSNISLSGNRAVLLYCQGGQYCVIGLNRPFNNLA